MEPRCMQACIRCSAMNPPAEHLVTFLVTHSTAVATQWDGACLRLSQGWGSLLLPVFGSPTQLKAMFCDPEQVGSRWPGCRASIRQLHGSHCCQAHLLLSLH